MGVPHFIMGLLYFPTFPLLTLPFTRHFLIGKLNPATNAPTMARRNYELGGNMQQPQQDNPLNEIRKLACSRLKGIQALYLFGSWGSEYQTPDSDIDIALLLTPQESKRFAGQIHMQLSIDIAELAAVERADVIDLRTADCILQTQIITYGQRFFTSDENATLDFEGLALSGYQKLQQERADIIKDGLDSGRFLHE